MITVAIIVFTCSSIGVILLFMRHVPEVRRMSNEELALVLQHEQPLGTQAWEAIAYLFRKLWYTYLRERTFVFLVKQVSRFRISILRLEQNLFRFASHMRERSRKAAEPSRYWQEIHGWKKTVTWYRHDSEASGKSSPTSKE